ncbi:MAG: UDP-2,3-diacylglucosamine diphosphatase [Alphaproteobacteria bacterium]|nr:UDP-2,3-diacylglucosamine diphosphatase [Alphaproteobacteria bacterium]
MNTQAPIRQYRAIWISDVHLGTRGSKAEYLLDFLRETESEYLYLVGDILDVWRLQKSWYFIQSHNDVIQKILRKARKGTKVVYLPGNHDEIFRDYLGVNFGEIDIVDETIHTTIDGKRFLVLHGDKYDAVVRYAKWLALLGDWAYNWLLRISHVINVVRRKLNRPYWSLSQFLKQRVKTAVQFIGEFENAVVSEAKERGVDGVICGHIHKAEMRRIDDVLYMNDGDWVESCTALVEHYDGRMEILEWTNVRQLALL